MKEYYRPVYKCKRCGAIKVDTIQREESSMKKAMISLGVKESDAQFFWPKIQGAEPMVPVNTCRAIFEVALIHGCYDAGFGIAELIGVERVEEREE